MTIRTRDPKTLKWDEYEFFDFETFYSFIKYSTQNKLFGPLTSFQSFNWDSDVIKDKFKDYYINGPDRKGFLPLRNSLHVKSDKNLTKKFWTDRGWTEEEAKKRVYHIQKSSSRKFSEKFKKDPSIRLTVSQVEYWEKKGHSREEAIELRRQHQLKGLKGTRTYVSKSSMSLFDPFINKYKEYEPMCGSKGDEFHLYDPERKRHYYYDLTFEKLKLIFEYNGRHCHPHPSLTDEERKKWSQYFTKKTADQVEEDDKKKIQFAESHGYKVIVLWEGDKNNPEIISSVLLKSQEKD